MEALLLGLIVLVCPLMMLMMMRGMAHGGHGRGHAPTSTAELRRRRDELDQQLAEREQQGVRR